MSYLSLSSSIDLYGRSLKNPTWSRVLYSLEKLKSNNGSICLSIIDPPLIGPESLSVRGDSGRYLISMLDNITEDDDEVRSYTNPKVIPGEKEVEILGDSWDASMVSDDIDLVRRVFKEFYETGNVSRTLLD